MGEGRGVGGSVCSVQSVQSVHAAAAQASMGLDTMLFGVSGS